MLPITLCLEIYLRCIKIALIAVMEESAQYHTPWPLLRPHTDQVMQCTGAGHSLQPHTYSKEVSN